MLEAGLRVPHQSIGLGGLRPHGNALSDATKKTYRYSTMDSAKVLTDISPQCRHGSFHLEQDDGGGINDRHIS
jgi:hypothetical protein